MTTVNETQNTMTTVIETQNTMTTVIETQNTITTVIETQNTIIEEQNIVNFIDINTNNYLTEINHEDYYDEFLYFQINRIHTLLTGNYAGYTYYLRLINILFNYTINFSDIYHNIAMFIIEYNTLETVEFEIITLKLSLTLLSENYRNINYDIYGNILVYNEPEPEPEPVEQIDVKSIVLPIELEKLKCEKFDDSGKKQTTCAICYEDYKLDTEICTIMCGHIYCKECIFKWLSEYSYKCPQCKEKGAEYVFDIKNE